MKVKDVMTREVLTVEPETPLKDVATLLVERGVSGLPVTDEDGRVVGVVSETDILYKERESESDRGGVLGHLFHRGQSELEAKLRARTAGEAMTAPAIMIRPEARVSDAAALMVDRGVNRLPVVEDEKFVGEVEDGELVGIVSRADLVRAFARPDEEIAREIRDIIERQFWLLPGEVNFTIQRGEVSLAGEVDLKGNAEGLASAVARVPGVVSVESELTWRLDEARVL